MKRAVPINQTIGIMIARQANMMSNNADAPRDVKANTGSSSRGQKRKIGDKDYTMSKSGLDFKICSSESI